MLIMQKALPGINKFLQPVAMNSRARELVVSGIIAFLMYLGKMSASQVAGDVPRPVAFLVGIGPLQHELLDEGR
jgi:hypothetical protein